MLLTSSWNFTLENYDVVWAALVQIGILLIALFIGNWLRNVIPFLKKSLIPSALIGGALVLGLNYICKQFGFDLVDNQLMQVITYHGLGIGFAALSLKTAKAKDKVGRHKTIENGVMTGATYMLQAFVGLLITLVLYKLTVGTSKEVFYSSGVILALGYGQGPGNALAWDVTYSAIAPQTFASEGSFGLTVASIGFIVASILGVIYINYYKRKGLISSSREDGSSIKKVDYFEEPDEIEDTDSVDKFSIQVGLVAICYGAAFAVMALLGKASSFLNSVVWGFNFIWGVLAADLVKVIHNLLRKKGLVKRKYINNYQMDRISGFAFDLMIVSGVAAIQIEKVAEFWLPLLCLCVIGAIVTFIYLRFVTKNIFKGYEHEMFVTNFGTLTGVASNGMILLKEIDPNFESPAESLFIRSQLPAMVAVAPLLLLLNFVGSSLNNAIIGCGIFFVLFVVYNLYIFRNFIFKKKEK